MQSNNDQEIKKVAATDAYFKQNPDAAENATNAVEEAEDLPPEDPQSPLQNYVRELQLEYEAQQEEGKITD